MSPLRPAVLAQISGWLIAFALSRIAYPPLAAHPYEFALAQGFCAALISYKLEAPPWWVPIHIASPPLLVAAVGLHWPPGVWLSAFALLMLVFWRTDSSRVPLYLSNRSTALELARLIPPHPCQVIDLGCGNGGLLRMIAKMRPDCRFVGIEHAPLPWLIAWVGSRRQTNLEVRYGDFWREPLGSYGLVYAFLSPAPMLRLWAKARLEMAPDALLISNSFAVPDQIPEQTTDVADRRRTRLLCYRPGRTK
ncbi:MAG: class I SAM-dependent methyltransferase [Rhodocyclaceae bacterium]|nr:class I SAM-dependent methyltransferase [Rhodocyclaceae bacterium]